MSHYHCEIIMPPNDDVEAAVAAIMAPFCEHEPDTEEARDEMSSYRFWDWYVIGGRWSGEKLRVRLGTERVQEFSAMLRDRGFTVSGLQFGKPTLQPASQIAEVDRLWREWFPNGGDVCPLFDHYKGGVGDVCRVLEMPDGLTAARVIVAGPTYKGDAVEAVTMVQRSFWNGVNRLDTTWDGTVAAALAQHAKGLERAADEWRIPRTVGPDWLVVTVDYHS